MGEKKGKEKKEFAGAQDHIFYFLLFFFLVVLLQRHEIGSLECYSKVLSMLGVTEE